MQPTKPNEEPIYSIQELAELGDVSRRTVRYYVRRELLPQPTGTGRGKHYTQHHLDTLLKIRALQEQGTSLDDIAAQLQPNLPQIPAPTPETQPTDVPVQHVWTRVELLEGIELHIRQRALTSEETTRLQDALRDILDL